MPLLKDIQTTLNKISMQSEKSNLQFEKTINSIKTSIKSIKNVNLNIKTLKISNDEYNKALKKSQANSTKLLKQIDNYLENPTQEEKLKVKNQINVSNNYLKIVKNVFSNNKISSDKLINSYNEYKNDGLITNAEELIKWNSRLKPSFTKLINYFGKLKTQTKNKAKAQTRKVYYSESPTLSPDCQKYKKRLEDEISEREVFKKDIDKDEVHLVDEKIKVSKLENDFLEQFNAEEDANRQLSNIHLEQKKKFYNYKELFQKVQDDNNNSVLTILNLDLAQALEEGDDIKIVKTLHLISENQIRINKNFDDLQEATVDLGSITKDSYKIINSIYDVIKEELKDKRFKHYDEMEKYETEIEKLIEKIKDNKELLIIRNEVIEFFEKLVKETEGLAKNVVKENCPS